MVILLAWSSTDSATEVLRLEGKKVQDAPDMITSGIDNNYIEGVGVLDEKRLLTLLDLTKVMASTDYEKILQVQQSAIQHFDEIKDENSEGGSDNETEKQTDTTETKPLPEKTGSERKVKSKVKKTQTKRRKNGS